VYGDSPHRRTRGGFWFAAFTIVSLVLLLASRTDQAVALQHGSSRALEPLRGAVAGAGSALSGLFGTIGEIERLRSENEDLRRSLAGVEQQLTELEEAAHENAELRELLGIVDALEMELLPARIIGRDPSNFSWEVTIDVGRDDGLRQGMPVVGSAEGAGALAGTVTEVGSDFARVRLVVDTRSSVIALVQRTRALGVVEGRLGGGLAMVQVNISDEVVAGDRVVTAGLAAAPQARSGYPKGLLIGTVQAIQPDPNALTQTVFVRPALDLQQLERILVVVAFEQG
jgi:rod shape-determining protein MreC